jgi:hypothetical protein
MNWKGQVFFQLSFEIAEGFNLKQRSSTCGLPGCILWPMATFINYVYTTKITQKFRGKAGPKLHVSKTSYSLGPNITSNLT